MPEPIHVAHRTCCFCEAVCGLRIEFRDGVPAHIRGDELDPSSRGYICPKGAAVARSDADPDRLRLPMARNRASGRHTEISWEEAFARVEEGFSRIDRRDPDSFALYYGTGIVHGAGYYYLPALAQAIPTQNIFSTSTVDQAPKQVACALMFGHPNSIPIPDIDRCNHLVIIGANPLQSNGSMMTAPGVANRLRRLRQRGGKIVVIDPLRTATAELADQYMPIKPATDVFLLAGMIHTLIEERLVRLGSLQEHVANLDQIAPAFSRFSPEVVSSVCGVPAAFIRTLAHETATRQAAAVYGRIGTTTQAFGTLASWMIDLVNILAGNLDQVGGMMFPKAAVGQYNSRIGRMRGSLEVFGPKTRVGGRPSINISRGFERPVVSLAEEIETAGAGQIRSLLTIGCNPVLTIPNGARVAKALDSLDFMVSVDPYINETTRFADVILPPEGDLAKQQYPSTYYQRSTRNVARWSPRSRPLAPHERSETEIYLRLASALRGDNAAPSLVDEHFIATLVEQWVLSAKGELPHLDGRKILEQLGDRSGIPRVIDFRPRSGPYGDQFDSSRSGIDLEALERNPHGIDLGPLAPRVPEVILTASGKIDLAPTPLLEDMKRMSTLAPPVDGLMLIGRRHMKSNNSWMHNDDELLRGNFCTLLLHPSDAADRGLRSGDLARVRNIAGELEVPVEVTAAIMPGVVSIPHGWGHSDPFIRLGRASASPGVNVNALVSDELVDPLTGNAAFSNVRVEVSAVDRAGAAMRGRDAGG